MWLNKRNLNLTQYKIVSPQNSFTFQYNNLNKEELILFQSKLDNNLFLNLN